MSDNYDTNKTNCNRCGTVMAWGWTLTCPACVTNQKLEEQNRILSSNNSVISSSSSSSSDGSLSIGSIITFAFLAWAAIGFLFFPDWGIVTFAKFLWTVILLLFTFVLAIPYTLFQILF